MMASLDPFDQLAPELDLGGTAGQGLDSPENFGTQKVWQKPVLPWAEPMKLPVKAQHS